MFEKLQKSSSYYNSILFFILTGVILNFHVYPVASLEMKSFIKSYGGKGDEFAYSVVELSNGFALVGFTSSFGAGNDDMWLVKTNNEGSINWNQTYGGLGDEEAYTAQIDQLRDRHRDTIRKLFPKNGERTALLATIDRYIAELNAFCRSIHVIGEVTSRGLDTIVSLGERMNARVVAAALRARLLDSQAVDATGLIITDDSFQSAMPMVAETRQKLQKHLCPLLDDGVIPVVTGFQF